MSDNVSADRRRAAGWALALAPWVLLLGQAVWQHQSLAARGRLEPIRVADTDSYIRVAKMETVEGALSHYRTYGYPLLLRTFGRDALIGIELRLYLLGTIALFAAVWVYTGSGWIALAAASPLLYADALGLLGRVQPDFVACAFVLFAVAALIGLVVRPRNSLLWALLAVAVFAAYQSRPATLFLILWLPVAGGLLSAFRDRTWRRPRKGWLLGLTLATVVPYLLFASFRAGRVGEFGLVAFGGYNMSGLAASLIDEATIETLEDEDQRMARAILRRRLDRGWEPYRTGEGSAEWFEQYSPNIFHINVQVAKGRMRARHESMGFAHGADESVHMAVNRRLRDFSREVIRRRPGAYLEWVRNANLHGWRQLGATPWVVWPAGLLAASLVLGWWGRRRGYLRPRLDPALVAAVGLLTLGLTFFAAYVFLISLLSFPFSRYYYGTVLLLPSGLCAALAALWLSWAQRSITASTSGASTGGREA